MDIRTIDIMSDGMTQVGCKEMGHADIEQIKYRIRMITIS